MNRVIASSVVAYVAIAARQSRELSQDLTRDSAEVTSSGRNDEILCPVLAALHRAGDLEADADGNVELEQMKDGLHHGLGVAELAASFQAHGICVYDQDEKNIEKHRRRCVPPTGTSCYLARKTGIFNSRTRRWMNLYTMNGKQALEHGISTGIRGGDLNMPPDALDCGGVYPCRARFEQFIAPNIKNGRFYLPNAMGVVCMARQFGDRSGENSYADKEMSLYGDWTVEPVPGPEWQMKGAMSSMVLAFGKLDADGERYLSRSDLEALFMEGRYPDGWQKHEHGCLLWGCEHSALRRFNMDVGECPVEMKAEWWQGSGCKTSSENSCSSGSACASGQTCVSGLCRCNRDEDGRATCFSGGSCKRQSSDSYTWFGKQRSQTYTPADNPEAPGNAE